MSIGRNAPCPCGSGKKFKKCHLPIWEEERRAQRTRERPRHGALLAGPINVVGVREAIEEGHHFWHECERTYHEPEQFRINMNALIQAARNVTFRIQSGKIEIPEFEQWYEPWRDEMRSVEVMRWLQDARTKVVHQSGLESKSRSNTNPGLVV